MLLQALLLQGPALKALRWYVWEGGRRWQMRWLASHASTGSRQRCCMRRLQLGRECQGEAEHHSLVSSQGMRRHDAELQQAQKLSLSVNRRPNTLLMAVCDGQAMQLGQQG